MSVNSYDADLYDAITDLVAEGELEDGSPAYGVAQQVISLGYDTLTPKQQTLYNAVVPPALMRRAEELRVLQIVNSAAP